jgi:hypothetical protein
MYDLGVAHGKDYPDTPYSHNGLNLHQYHGPTGFVVWKQVNSLGDHSVFLGLNYLITVNLKICDCQAPDGTLVPFMRKNCVYTSYRRF